MAVLVGPEGGLTEDERNRLERSGARAVSFGPHILRSETAALFAVSAIVGHYQSGARAKDAAPSE